MSNGPDPFYSEIAETFARPVGVVVARPLQFVDAPPALLEPPNPMRIESISRGQALLDIAILIGSVLLMIGFFSGVRILLSDPLTDPQVQRVNGTDSPAQVDRNGANVNEAEYESCDGEADHAKVDLLGTAAMGLVGSAIVLAIGKWRGLSLASIGLPAFSSMDILLGLAAAIAAFAAHFLGIGITLVTWPNAWETMSESSSNIIKALPPGSVWKYLIIFLAVGFYEELVFRGFFLTRIRRWVGPWWLAVVLSSLCFAIPHMGLQEPTVLPSLFLLAVTFSIFTLLRRSLYPAMIGHWLFNSIMIVSLHTMVSAQPS